MKRLIAMLLALALTVSVMPVSAMSVAAEELQLTETAPVEESTEEVAESAEKTVEPTEEVAESAEEAVESTEEVAEPAEEAVEPTEEVVEPTEEAVEPTEEEPSRDVPTRASVSYSGTWGSNLTWKIYSDGVLEISGTGEMANMGSYDAPWRNYTTKFNTVVVCEGVTSVEKYAFQDYYNLVSVTLADSVTTLEDRAFYDCYKLTTVDLGGVTSIGERTFYDCVALQTVTSLENVTHIGGYAFSGCEALTSVTFSNELTAFGEYAFAYCDKLSKADIPEGVTTIGNYAFAGCALSEIVIPDSVTTIGASAFRSCSSATRIVIGDGVTATGSQAFYGCKALEELVIGNNVELIGSGAFYNCLALKEVYIPDSVTEIQSSAFYGGEAITDVYLGSGLREEYCINSDAFKYCKSIENVWYRGTEEQWYDMSVFGNSYQGTQYLTEANRYYMMGTCGEAVEWDIAFDGTMTIAGTGPMFDYGGENGYPDWNDNVYTKVKKIVVEPGVTKIGNESFGWMENLTELVLPEGLEEIGAYAFPNSSALKTVKLPASLNGYWTGAFYGCASLDGIWAHEDSEYYYNDSHGVLFNYDGVLIQAPGSLSGTYTIPEGVTTIAPYAFAQCEKLEVVNYPASVTSIGEHAFYRCWGLTKLNIPETVKEIKTGAFVMCTGLTTLDIPKGITRIEEAVFDECFGLTEIVIPDNITYIGNSAFFDCFNVTSVTIPDSVTYIDNYAFSWLWALESVTIPDSVTYLGYGAFDTCEALKTVNLGTGLTVLKEDTFNGCFALEEVYIPKNIQEIEAGAFNGCQSLQTVWYNGTEAEWNIMDITNQGNEYLQGVQLHFLKEQGSCGAGVNWRMMQDGSLVIFGSGAMEDYTDTAAPWAKYAGEIEAIQVADGVTAIGANAFAGLNKLVYAEIRDTIATVGDGAFSGCTALPAIGFPESVTQIAANAFSGCSSLEEVYLPSQLTSIGDNAFAGCTKLPGVELPGTLTQIGAEAFSNCKALTEIFIPAAVSAIGDNAFTGCAALANICVAEDNTAYSTDAQGVLFNKEKTELLLTPVTLSGHYIVPAGVTAIAANAFSCKELTAITIPASLQTVGQNAFVTCRKLTSVRYYDNAEQWNTVDFASGNDRLLNAKITFTQASGSCGENLFWEIESGGLLIISGSGAMYDYNAESAPWAEYAASIHTVQIGENITSIGAGAFRDFTALTSLEIPHSVTSIGAEAFAGCKNLITLSIGNGVTFLGSEAFLGCNSLKSVSVGAGLAVDKNVFAFCAALETIEIDPMNPYCQSVDGLVYSADGKTLVTVPVGRSGSITLPRGVEVIGNSAFENSGLSSVTLPEGVTTVEERAFLNAHVKEVYLPNTLTEIGIWAFAGTKLQSVMLPDSVVTLDEYAFHGCAELISVTLPDGLTAIENSVFGGCSALKTVTVPASVTEIGAFAFDECTALTTVFWQGTAEEFGALTVGSFNEPFAAAMIVVDQKVAVLAAPNASSGKPQLTWEAVEGVTKYEVHRASSIDGKYKKLKSVSSTNYTDTSASAGKEYYYKIKALYGKTAVEIGTAVAGCVLAQPKVKVSVSSSTGLPSLSWSKISGAYRYVILRAEKAATYDNEYIELAVQKGTSFTDKTAQPDKVYYYKVMVTSSKENADCISPAPVRVVTGIAKPSIKVTANENGKPQITCEELPGAVSYTLYRSASKKGTYTQLLVSDAPFFVDDSAEVGKTYYYKVSAAGNHSESAVSSYDDVRCVAVSPEIAVTRSDATGKAYITWEAVDGAKKYEIHRSTKENSGYKKIATTDKLFYSDTDASVGKTYYYRVYTVPSSSKAKSMPSNTGSVYAICAQPVLKVSYSASGQHTISWSKVSGAKKYEIWRGDAENGLFIRLTTQKGTSYTDKDTQPDTVYYYYVNAIASKPENDSIEADPVKIARAITAPRISVGNDGYGKPVVTWDAVEGAVRYKIYRATSSKGDYTLVGNVTGTSYTNERVDVGARYYYKVSALGSNSESAMSSYDDTYAKLPATVMTGGEQDLATGKPVIYWDPVDGVEKYDVYRATSADGKYKKIASGVKTVSYYDVDNNLYYMTYTDKDAKNNTTYYYKVVSVTSNTKANSVLSDWISVTSGNISASDAKVRANLIKMERWIKYLNINADILRLEVQQYKISGDKYGVILDMMDNVAECRDYIAKVRKLCGNNTRFYMLDLECKSADAPIWGGNDSKYAIAVESFATDCDHIVSMYNIMCNSYGLPTVD